MELVNTRPHPVIIETDKGSVFLSASTEPAPRAIFARRVLRLVPVGDGSQKVTVTVSEPTKVHHLPARREGVLFIVSKVVASACPERDDLIFPDQMIRKGGQVQRARTLTQVPRP